MEWLWWCRILFYEWLPTKIAMDTRCFWRPEFSRSFRSVSSEFWPLWRSLMKQRTVASKRTSTGDGAGSYVCTYRSLSNSLSCVSSNNRPIPSHVLRGRHSLPGALPGHRGRDNPIHCYRKVHAFWQSPQIGWFHAPLDGQEGSIPSRRLPVAQHLHKLAWDWHKARDERSLQRRCTNGWCQWLPSARTTAKVRCYKVKEWENYQQGSSFTQEWIERVTESLGVAKFLGVRESHEALRLDNRQW